jgi:hypothetical protein
MLYAFLVSGVYNPMHTSFIVTPQIRANTLTDRRSAASWNVNVNISRIRQTVGAKGQMQQITNIRMFKTFKKTQCDVLLAAPANVKSQRKFLGAFSTYRTPGWHLTWWHVGKSSETAGDEGAITDVDIAR